ncbi:MAG: hypothetical protein HY695_02180 [Deltaproteobacteria bacterium]|nr:hypothetical protein [Deltaproteobacteria bacterium]
MVMENGVFAGPLRKSTKVPSPDFRRALTMGCGMLQEAKAINKTAHVKEQMANGKWRMEQKFNIEALEIAGTCDCTAVLCLRKVLSFPVVAQTTFILVDQFQLAQLGLVI